MAGRVFHDGFESGNTNLWNQADYRNRCAVVTTAADSGVGPYSGTYMARANWDGTVAWNDPACFESLNVQPSYTNELFYRCRFRVDNNLTPTGGSATKILRIWYWNGSVQNDLYCVVRSGSGMTNEGVANNTQLDTYYGSYNAGEWNEVEYYISLSSDVVKVWFNGSLVRNDSVNTGSSPWNDFYITSNWEDSHDATNYIYFDEIEIFSDTGTGGTGSMSDGTITQGGALLPGPANVRWRPA